ncbi:MAG: hypothetical protein K2X27_21320 [Candidatus Obscuribacterales bacterium]|nr:hypothetical protein [Candidatus Obscuribacterales bacterium]
MSSTSETNQVAGLLTKLRISGAAEMAAVTDGLVKVMMAGARYPGFWSAEILPPAVNSRGEWTLVQRFSTAAETADWMQSELRKELLEALRAVAPGRILTWDEVLNEPGAEGTVATAVVTDVKAGMEALYWDWESKIQSAQARFPGYRGTYIQPPPPDRPGRWTTLIRFETPESLNAWLLSEERKSLLSESNLLVSTTHFQNMSSSFPGWFPLEHIPIWKTASLVLIAVFPVVIGLKAFLLPLMKGQNSTLVLILGTFITVAVLSFVLMPVLVRSFRWWLNPEPEKAARLNAAGALIVVAILLLQAILFWDL